jgi:hypothetical protein
MPKSRETVSLVASWSAQRCPKSCDKKLLHSIAILLNLIKKLDITRVSKNHVKNAYILLNPIKKCIDVRLVVIYDSQATNRKQGGLSVKASSSRHPPIGCLGVYMTPSRPECIKTPLQTGGSFYRSSRDPSGTLYFG